MKGVGGGGGIVRLSLTSSSWWEEPPCFMGRVSLYINGASVSGPGENLHLVGSKRCTILSAAAAAVVVVVVAVGVVVAVVAGWRWRPSWTCP